MSTNEPNDSVISKLSGNEEGSDTDSTDYEPEPKKCKLEDASQGEANLVGCERDSLIAVPIRASTVVVSHSSRNEGGSGTSGRHRPPSGEGGGDGGSGSLMTVGDLVQQTLEASLGHHPIRQTSSISQGGLFSQLNDSPETAMTQANRSPPEPPPTAPHLRRPLLSDFRAIAREVMQGPGSFRRYTHGRGSGRRGRRLNENTVRQNEDNANGNESGSSSSCSSSEYFTDDIDPLEIPSDEYLSPPFPTRRRRNAIFVRRDPPPATAQNEDDQYYHNELEVASNLDINENPIENGSSTSEVDDEVLRRSHSPPPELPPEETDNNFADNENVKSDGDADSEPTQQPASFSVEPIASDSELSEKDKGLCNQCHAQKPEPFFNYCLRCFKIRRTWLPPRPASRRLKSRKAQLRNSNTNSLNNSTNSRTRSSDTSESEDDVVDGGPPRALQAPSTSSPTATVLNSVGSTQIQRSLPFSQPIDMNEGFLIDENNPVVNRLTPDTQPGNVTLMELFTQPESRATRYSEPSIMTSPDTDSQSQSQSVSSSSQSQGSLFSQNSQNSCTQSSSSPSQPLQSSSPLPKNTENDIIPNLNSLCAICFVREKDAAFVHNKIAHLYCCYTCADKILKKNGKCPICRERVLRVVKIISV